MKLVAMIPAYNEKKTIASVIEDIPRQIEGIASVEVLVIDDGSTDSTLEQARKAGADKVISHRTNLGLGIAFKDGLDSALKMGADIIVNLDAVDFNIQLSDRICRIAKDPHRQYLDIVGSPVLCGG